MRITDLFVDGFGVWKEMPLRNLSPEITVFYGPNEAGKTTLLEFFRSMLYGVSDARRARYLPPIEGGKPGGRIGLATDEGVFEATRYVERGDDDRGRVVVHLPDGAQEGDRLLREALEGVDEAIFNNVFAVGLDEIQSLGGLGGDEAAKAIYRLTSGLDRVSLYDLIQGLRSSRTQLLDARDQSSVLADLAARRDDLLTKISELSAKGRRWATIGVELEELGHDIDQTRVRLKEAERTARRVEVALGLKPLWSERTKIDDRLSGFAGLYELPATAMDDLDELNGRIEEQKRQHDILQGQRKQLREEAEALDINETLVRNGCRLEGLAEQREWIEALERIVNDSDEQLQTLDARVESERNRLAKLWLHEPDHAPMLTRETVGELDPQAKSVAKAERAVEQARLELDSRRGSQSQYRAQIDSARAVGDKLGLPAEISDAGDLVAQLRNRQQVGKKLEQARRQARDLDQRSHELLDRQITTPEFFVLMFAIFVFGFLMLGWWWWRPEATFAGWASLVSIGGVCLIWLLKFFNEDSAVDQLDSAQRQLESLENQIKDSRQDQEKIDQELSVTEGSVSMRLQEAERHLADLEQTLPIEAQRRQADQHAMAAETELASSEQRLSQSLDNWRQSVQSLGLPANLTPNDLRTMAGQYEQLAELELKAENRREEWERRQREYAKVAQRIEALAEESDLVIEDVTPLDQLEAILSERRLQQTRIDQRKKLRERAKELQEKQKRHSEAIASLQADREAFFRRAGVADEEAYRQLAAKLGEADRLRGDRDRVTREIAAAIGAMGTENDFSAMLASDAVGRLDSEWEKLAAKLESIDAELRESLARRGSLEEQRKSLAQDTALADRQMELDQIDAQIAEARERWRERAVIGQLLELIRSDYEANRQPETLQEASRYLEQLTGGRYQRVWTPLANDILLVDDREGRSLAVEALSRGTREQLLISVRMALVAMYARRGVRLPMILDDILVNFDAGRSRTAARVLCDFAKAGHQLLVFTCHEHVWEMFKDLHADVRRLPDRYALDASVEVVEPVECAELPEPLETSEEVVEEVAQPTSLVEEDLVMEELEPSLLEAEYVELAPREPGPTAFDYEYVDLPLPEARPRNRDVEYEHRSVRDATGDRNLEYTWDQPDDEMASVSVSTRNNLPEPIVYAWDGSSS